MGGKRYPECMGVKRAQTEKQVGCEIPGSTEELQAKLFPLSVGEESGIPSVAVKCVDIRRNTSGEGDFLDDN